MYCSNISHCLAMPHLPGSLYWVIQTLPWEIRKGTTYCHPYHPGSTTPFFLINDQKTNYYFNTLLQHLHPGVLLTEIWVNIGKMIANYQEIITLVSYHIMLCCVWSWQVAVYWHMIQWFLVTHLVSLRPIPQCFTASVRTKWWCYIMPFYRSTNAQVVFYLVQFAVTFAHHSGNLS